MNEIHHPDLCLFGNPQVNTWVECAAFGSLTGLVGARLVGSATGALSAAFGTLARFRLQQLPESSEPICKKLAVFYISQMALLLPPAHAVTNRGLSRLKLLQFGLATAAINAGLLAADAVIPTFVAGGQGGGETPPDRSSTLSAPPLSLANFAVAPELPVFQETDALASVPTIRQQAFLQRVKVIHEALVSAGKGQVGQFFIDQATSENRLNELDSELREKCQVLLETEAWTKLRQDLNLVPSPDSLPLVDKPSDHSGAVHKEHYKIVRNLAALIRTLPDDETRVALRLYKDANGGCRTRQIAGYYDILTKFNAEINEPLEDARNKMAKQSSELKEQLIRHGTVNIPVYGGDMSHTWAAILETCGKELGLVTGPINPEAVFEGSDADADAQANWISGSLRNHLRQPCHQRAFIQQVQNAYLALDSRQLIDRVHGALNLDTTLRNQLMGVLAEHLAQQSGASGKTLVSDEFYEADHPVTKYYCDQPAQGGSSLNYEGVILLMKMTGYLVDDGRLHTTESNETILQGPPVGEDS